MKATNRLLPTDLRRAAALMGLLLCAVASVAQTPAPVPAPGSPGKVLVADVIIEGNRNVTAQQIKGQIKTRPGAEFNEETAREDVRVLMSSKQLGNVEVVTQPTPDGRVNVFFLIRDYPNLVQKVVYQGAKHPSNEDLDALHSIRPNTPLNPTANKLACQAIVRKYNEEGRPFAECHLLKGDKPGDTEVIFQITEGPKATIHSISFEGNTFVSGAVLNTHLNAMAAILGIGGSFNPLMVDADIAKLEEYYHGFGYLDAKVSCEYQWTAGGQEVNLVFHVAEGRRYLIQDTPHVIGKFSVPIEQLEQVIKVNEHDYVNKGKLDLDQRNITDYIGYTGHKAKVETNVVYSPDAPGLVHVNYEVEEQPVATVGQILIVGNTRTQPEHHFAAARVLPRPDPDLSRSAYRGTQLGAPRYLREQPDGSVKPTVTLIENRDDPNNASKDVLVTVQEANTGSLMFGLGVNSDSGLTGSIVLNERNFDITRPPTSFDELLSGDAWRGAGQEFRLEAVPGTELQRYSATFREPFLFDSLFSFSTSGYYYQREYNEDEETRYGGRFSIGRKLTDTISATVGVRVENVNIGDITAGAPPDYTNAQGNNFQYGPNIGLTYDTRDSFIRPTAGLQVSASYEEMFGEHTFPLLNLEANKFFTIWERPDGSGRQVLVLHSQISWAGDNTPVYERYYAGGFRSLRGFAFRGVGPDINGFMVGGDFQFLNSVEYQVPILANDHFYTVAFVDSGTVESRAEIGTYRVAAGFGFRFQVPMLGQVPIALDFGFPVIKSSGDQTQVFSFWLGFSR